jgi:hypothetical protein
LLPPLQPSAETEEMYMMIRPAGGIYKCKLLVAGGIYKCKGELLDRIVHQLPEKICLRDP